MLLVDGNQYEGQWEQDARVGRGQYEFANGDVLQSESWEANAVNGPARYAFANDAGHVDCLMVDGAPVQKL